MMRNRDDFSTSLLQWFQVNGRDFPWRLSKDAYEVLIAEKLLQQTSVRQSLIDLYIFFLNKYPSPSALAQADIDDLRGLIQPLGLHYRAKDLILMATDIVARFNGKTPRDLADLISLYGVGDYSARAVLSFVYANDVAVVDTNVARILYRVFEIPGKFPQNPARSRKLINLAQSLLLSGKSKEFNWAMIDLGALICLPRNPHCKECPINHLCKYYAANISFQ